MNTFSTKEEEHLLHNIFLKQILKNINIFEDFVLSTSIRKVKVNNEDEKSATIRIEFPMLNNTDLTKILLEQTNINNSLKDRIKDSMICETFSGSGTFIYTFDLIKFAEIDPEYKSHISIKKFNL